MNDQNKIIDTKKVSIDIFQSMDFKGSCLVFPGYELNGIIIEIFLNASTNIFIEGFIKR